MDIKKNIIYSKDVEVKNINGMYYENIYDFETRVVENMTEEIEELDKCIEYIIKNKQANLTISRNTESEEVLKSQEIPSDSLYFLGIIHGDKFNNKFNNKSSGEVGIEMVDYIDKHYDKDRKFLYWTEWVIKDANNNYRCSMNIRITPHVVYFTSSSPTIGDEEYETNKIVLRTSYFFEKWDERLEKIYIENKKSKVPSVINSVYKSMGVDRKAKIEKLLGR